MLSVLTPNAIETSCIQSKHHQNESKHAYVIIIVPNEYKTYLTAGNFDLKIRNHIHSFNSTHNFNSDHSEEA